MNTNEIVKALREIKVGCSKCLRENYTDCGADCSDRYILTAADKIERLQKELDAAVGDMFGTCSVCKHSFRQTKIPCGKRSDVKIDEHGYIICDFEWRGQESEVSE